jgi:hypothetical protein
VPQILFKGTILVRGLVLALATGTLWVRRGTSCWVDGMGLQWRWCYRRAIERKVALVGSQDNG